MTAAERRKQILHLLRETAVPVSGTALGHATGVSRQIVVQDIALLRTEGYPILATARGYLLDVPNQHTRLLKVCHTDEQTEEELNLIVDLGGCVQDVRINHRIYGTMQAPLNIRNRRDVQRFLESLKSGRSTPLLNVTSGYHFHQISADQDEILDEIEASLQEHGFLAERLPYEVEE